MGSFYFAMLLLVVFSLFGLTCYSDGATWTSEYYSATDQTPYHFVQLDTSKPFHDVANSGSKNVFLDIPLQPAFKLFGTHYDKININNNGLIRFSPYFNDDSYVPGGELSFEQSGCHAQGSFIGINVFRVPLLYEYLYYGQGEFAQYFSECPRPSQVVQNEPCTAVFFNYSTVYHYVGGRGINQEDPVEVQALLYHSSYEIVLQYHKTGIAPGEVGVWYESDNPASLVIFCIPRGTEDTDNGSQHLAGKAIRISPLSPTHATSFPARSSLPGRSSPFPVQSPQSRTTTTGGSTTTTTGRSRSRRLHQWEKNILLFTQTQNKDE